MEIQKKHTVLIAGGIIMLCLGIFYIWSIFQASVIDFYGWSNAQASMTFYVMLSVNVTGIIAGGRINYAKGPRFAVFLGCMLFVVGLTLSSFVPRSMPWLLYVFYGGFGGFGTGVAYTAMIACAEKWWADRKGIAVGIIVGAFGASTVLFTPIVNALLSNTAIGLAGTFRILAAIFFIVSVGAIWAIKNPPEEYTERFTCSNHALSNKKQFSPLEVLQTKQYYLLLLCFLCLPPTYYILNPLLKTLGQQRGLPETAALGSVMITGIASAVGRLTAAGISDRIGPKKVIYILYGLMFVSAVFLAFAQGYAFIALIAVISYAYGGCAGITPVITADFFGTKHLASNFGLVMIAIAISGLAFPAIANLLSVDGMPTILTFAVPAVECVIGAIAIVLARPPEVVPAVDATPNRPKG
jgi:OFA family oxalate/formate antiporter-like MFS transporter